MARKDLSSVEKWCNDFAYYFLIGDYDAEIENIHVTGPKNDYHFDIIEKISKETHLSKIALFTRLLFQGKISQSNYNKIKADFDKKHKARIEEDRRKKELVKELGIKQRGSVPQPIRSPLLISTIQTAFYEGVLNEYEVCKSLNIKPEKLDEYLQ